MLDVKYMYEFKFWYCYFRLQPNSKNFTLDVKISILVEKTNKYIVNFLNQFELFVIKSALKYRNKLVKAQVNKYESTYEYIAFHFH